MPIHHSINHLLAGKIPADTSVTIKGWVRTRRDSKAGISFLNVHDGSCFSPIQVVIANTLTNYQSEILNLTAGCSVSVTGKLMPSPAQGQKFEIQADSVEVVGWVEDPDTYPISPKHHTLEYLRDVAHLRPRTNTIGAMTRIRDCLAKAVHRFFHERQFYWISTPIITSSDCEGAGELFRVSTLDALNPPRTANNKVDFSQDFFGKEAYLTVSGQLNAECYCEALSKVYTFGPTFRAENSNTARHLAEFWMIEPEVAFADLHDNITLADDLLKYVIKAVLAERADDMAFFAEHIDKECITRLENFIANKVEILDYTKAIDILQQSKQAFELPVTWGMDLQTEHERYLAEQHVKGPVALVNYPKEIKAFYMRLNEDQKTVAAMDVLVPGIGELIGGSQREERLEVLTARIKEHHLDPQIYSWYLDLRRYGTVPHAGFGLGFERLVRYVTGLNNVRDVIPFPRTPKHATF
jgi:asparaginyl-tRNA synthetase